MHSKIMTISLAFITLFLSTACIDQGPAPKIPGIDGPHFNIQNGKIVLSVGLEAIDLPGGVTLPIPKLENSSATISPRLEGGTLLRVDFDLNDVESEEFKVVPAQTLPDGRGFPFTFDNTLPALAIEVPKFRNTTFYVSDKLFGFFLPIKLPKGFNTSIHYRLKVNNKNIGIVSLIHPNEQGEGSGVVLILTLSTIQDNPEAKQLLNLSKKKKFRKVLF